MSALRRKQSNAMLYTLIVFVGLFIIAAAVAVVYYVKAEEYRIDYEDVQGKLNDFASQDEQADIGSIVGSKRSISTWLETMVQHFDDSVSMILGGQAKPTSVEVKAENIKSKVAETLKLAGNYISIMDPNLTGLVQVVTELTAKLDETIEQKDSFEKMLKDTQAEYAEMEETHFEEFQKVLDEKDDLVLIFEEKKQEYDDLKQLLREETDEQVQSLYSDLERERDNLKKTNNELLETQARLSETQELLAVAMADLTKIEPGPDPNVEAYIPDGEIISVDNNAKIAYLNIGSNDRVYQGLTLSVYDKGTSISENGQGKAEIQVYHIEDVYSVARITKSEINKPILKGDLVANLIWDSQRTNEFIIAGDFDLDNDGYFDFNATDKIKALIEKWGGKVADQVSIETNYLILGKQPQVLQRPTIEEQQLDPTALQQYEMAVERLNLYNDLKSKAKDLWIPIFTYEKFLHFIGYTSAIGQAGAF